MQVRMPLLSNAKGVKTVSTCLDQRAPSKAFPTAKTTLPIKTRAVFAGLVTRWTSTASASSQPSLTATGMFKEPTPASFAGFLTFQCKATAYCLQPRALFSTVCRKSTDCAKPASSDSSFLQTSSSAPSATPSTCPSLTPTTKDSTSTSINQLPPLSSKPKHLQAVQTATCGLQLSFPEPTTTLFQCCLENMT